MSTKAKIGFVSLGCPKNLVDTEVMMGLVKRDRFILVNDEKEADVLIINTCCFIDEAYRESHSTILEFSEMRRKGKLKKLIVTGCLPQRYKNRLTQMYPFVDHFLGSSDFPFIRKYLKSDATAEEKVCVGSPNFIYSSKLPRINSQGNHTAYVKIAEGCSERCTFCIVPKLRGRFRSRSIEDVTQEVSNLVGEGVREINLIAQNLTVYGRDIAKRNSLAELLKRLCKIKSLKWIRLLYNYPRDFSGDLIDLITSEAKICNYVDLPLQHIDDEILTKMGRQTNSDDIRRLLDRLRRIEGLVIRTSFIIGFPGETRRKFRKLINFTREYEFEKVVIFPYSREEGTVAYKLGDNINFREKLARYDELMEVKKMVAMKRNERFLGKSFDVLVEQSMQNNGKYVLKGRFYGQAPEVDGEVHIESEKMVPVGKFRRVKFCRADSYDFYGNFYARE